MGELSNKSGCRLLKSRCNHKGKKRVKENPPQRVHYLHCTRICNHLIGAVACCQVLDADQKDESR